MVRTGRAAIAEAREDAARLAADAADSEAGVAVAEGLVAEAAGASLEVVVADAAASETIPVRALATTFRFPRRLPTF